MRGRLHRRDAGRRGNNSQCHNHASTPEAQARAAARRRQGPADSRANREDFAADPNARARTCCGAARQGPGADRDGRRRRLWPNWSCVPLLVRTIQYINDLDAWKSPAFRFVELRVDPVTELMDNVATQPIRNRDLAVQLQGDVTVERSD